MYGRSSSPLPTRSSLAGLLSIAPPNVEAALHLIVVYFDKKHYYEIHRKLFHRSQRKNAYEMLSIFSGRLDGFACCALIRLLFQKIKSYL